MANRCWCVRRLQGPKASLAVSVGAFAGRRISDSKMYRDQMWREIPYFLIKVKQHKNVMPGIRYQLVLFSITCALPYLKIVYDFFKK